MTTLSADYFEPTVTGDTVDASPAEADQRVPASHCTRNLALFVWDQVWHSPQQGDPRQKTVFVAGLSDPRVRLQAPLPVLLELSPEGVTAWSYDLEEYGVGADELEALRDFQGSVVELYFTLKEHASALGPVPARQWQHLQQIIREV